MTAVVQACADTRAVAVMYRRRSAGSCAWSYTAAHGVRPSPLVYMGFVHDHQAPHTQTGGVRALKDADIYRCACPRQ
ncbi:hypothetical protein [Streptomyces sviceus]|uniref:hypothetical protein n=1 Tax=Streptomyces sviceus TaxID=285530 RepID=UPI00369DA444